MIDDSDLERLAARLGREAPERIDTDRVAARVVARLREPGRVVITPWRQGRNILLAATIAGLLVGVGLFTRTRGPVQTVERGEFPVPLALEELSTSDLVDVLDSLALEAPLHEVRATGLHDLDEAELRELLRMLES